MFLLTDRFEDSFEFEDDVLNIDMSFDNILRVFELFDDPLFKSYEKVLIVLEMLVIEYERIEDLDFMEQFNLYIFIMKKFLNIDLDKENEGKEEEQKKIMDFEKDAGLIYASFLSEYNIDLFEQHGKLHWNKFSELLSNLGDETAFKQVVGYRVMKVPTVKETSKEHREHVQKMKKLYALEDAEEIQDNMENKLNAIASSFSRGGNDEKRK